MDASRINLHLLVYLAVICGYQVAGQHQQAQDWHQTSGEPLDPTLGERVDRLASLSGDFFWRPSPEQLEWITQSRYRKPPTALADAYYAQALQQAASTGFEGPSGAANYQPGFHTELKPYSRLPMPNRESRAFKPKLMSTARGFGKRARLNDQRLNYPDLQGSARSVGAITSDAKTNGEIMR